MPEILLTGLVVILIYFISHHAVMKIEAVHGKALGALRSAWFFIIFLGLLLIAMQIGKMFGNDV